VTSSILHHQDQIYIFLACIQRHTFRFVYTIFPARSKRIA